jgi:hypothetical protein
MNFPEPSKLAMNSKTAGSVDEFRNRGQQTGRSGAGNLRNFKAMNDGKLSDVFADVLLEDNDSEATDAIRAELARRVSA